MKIKTLLLGLIGLGFGLTSCNLETNDEDNYVTWQFPVCNLVMPDNGTAFATTCFYALPYYYNSNTIAVSTTELSLGYSTFNFSTNPMVLDSKNYSNGNVSSFSGGIAKTGNVNISGLSGYISDVYNNLTKEENGVFNVAFSGFSPIVMNYRADYDYTVKTFSPDAVYTGVTNVAEVSGTVPPFQNENIKYRVLFNKELNKATVYLYNAKFTTAPQAPVIHFALRNLDVEYTKEGYKISGTEVVPQQYNGLDDKQQPIWKPMPNYTLDTFELINASSDLTACQIRFTLPISFSGYTGQYLCTFNGAYVYSTGKTN